MNLRFPLRPVIQDATWPDTGHFAERKGTGIKKKCGRNRRPFKIEATQCVVLSTIMKAIVTHILAFILVSAAQAQNAASNIPYVENGHKQQVLDIYAPPSARNLPVVFWIHGGGWEQGDKSQVKLKPHWFMDKGFVFVSTNYRLLPEVDMGTLIRDVAKAYGWMRKHIAEYGGDPRRVLVGGHSAGAQLAAILCTDGTYLREEGVSFDDLIGCVPVDGDTYDVPAIIETAETRLRVHHLPPRVNGHREKFGRTAANHIKFSAVTHVAGGKGIPPFLILHVAAHPDTTAQAQRLGAVLKEAGVPATIFGAKDTSHVKLNDNLGLPDDPATKALGEFIEKVTRR
jgi:arylformamidase